MEALKTFETLSDSVKIKFFKVLGILNEESSSATSENSSVIPQINELNVFFESLKSRTNNTIEENVNPEQISPSPETRKKQKTLDSWLIKRDGGLSSKTKEILQSPVQTPNENLSTINDDLGTCSSSVNNTPDSIHLSDHLPEETSRCSKSIKSKNCTIEKSKNVGMNNSRSNTSPNPCKTVYSLRSKRKLSELHTYDESEDSAINNSEVCTGNDSTNAKINKDVTRIHSHVNSQISQDLRLSTESADDSSNIEESNTRVRCSPTKKNHTPEFSNDITSHASNSSNNFKSGKNTRILQKKVKAKNDMPCIVSDQHVSSQITQDLGLSTESVNDYSYCHLEDSNTGVQYSTPKKTCTPDSSIDITSYASNSCSTVKSKGGNIRILQKRVQVENDMSCSNSVQHIVSSPVCCTTAEIHTPAEGNSSSQSDYEKFCKMSTVRLRDSCYNLGLNMFEILEDENIQTLLTKYGEDTFNNAVVFIGAQKSNTGKTMPVVHMHASKSKLFKNLCEVQKTLKNE